MEADKFNNLCSHYTDSFNNHKKSVKQRDTLFYILLSILAVFTLQITSPDIVATTTEEYVNNSLGIKIGNNIEFIATLFWLLLFGFSTKYFQVVVEIQRQYKYLHAIEELLNKSYQGIVAFTREGKSYFDNYPLFSNWVWLLYTIIFPTAIIISTSIKIYGQTYIQNIGELNYLTDLVSFFLIIISTILYMHELHR